MIQILPLLASFLPSKGRLIGLAVALIVGAGVVVMIYRAGWNARDGQVTVQRQEAILAKARIEREWRDKVHEIKTQHAIEHQNIIVRYDAMVRSLQQRAERRADRATAAACQGATGAELSREDAEFLAGEATRADAQRNGLSECYAWIDAVR